MSYRTIVADPPWHYGNRVNDPTHRGRLPYPSAGEVAALKGRTE